MPVKVFFCYAHEDEYLLEKLKTQLKPLLRQGLIDVWYDRDISAGAEWEQEIRRHLNTADIILLLVSPDFMDSEYCYSTEMKGAIERHERGEARVIPIILRPVYWQGVLSKLQALPKDARPVVSQYWHSLDDAFFDIAENIRKVVEKSTSQPAISLPEEFHVVNTLLEKGKKKSDAKAYQLSQQELIDKNDPSLETHDIGLFDVNDQDFEVKVLQSSMSMPVIVHFWAAWCGLCRTIAPVYERLSEEYKGKLSFAKMDIDEYGNTPLRLGIKAIPTLIIFNKYKEISRIVSPEPQRLKTKIDRCLKDNGL